MVSLGVCSLKDWTRSAIVDLDSVTAVLCDVESVVCVELDGDRTPEDRLGLGCRVERGLQVLWEVLDQQVGAAASAEFVLVDFEPLRSPLGQGRLAA